MTTSVSTASRRSRLPALPAALAQFLSAAPDRDIGSVSTYITQGGALMDAAALQALAGLRAELRAKLRLLEQSVHLRRRIALLLTYCEEAGREGGAGTPTHCEAAFALLYFLQGADHIPDSLPEIGLLDDALIVQLVLHRHAVTFRAHWLRHGRVWPVDL